MTSRSPRSSRPGRPSRGAARKTSEQRKSPKTRQLPKTKQVPEAEQTPQVKRSRKKSVAKNRPTPPQQSARQVVVQSDSSDTLERTIAQAGKPASSKRRPSWRQGSTAAARRASQRPGAAQRPGASSANAARRPEKSAPRAVAEVASPTTERRSIVWNGKERSHSIPIQWTVFALVVLVSGALVLNPISRYVAQQQEKRAVLTSLEETKARIDVLEKSLAKWQDDAFVKSQARERLGYVMPGETLYLVSDPERGTAKEQLDKRTAEVNRKMRQATPFYLTVWDSVTIAGGAGEADQEVENPGQVPLLNMPSEQPNPEP